MAFTVLNINVYIDYCVGHWWPAGEIRNAALEEDIVGFFFSYGASYELAVLRCFFCLNKVVIIYF